MRSAAPQHVSSRAANNPPARARAATAQAFDDGKFVGRVEAATPTRARVRLTLVAGGSVGELAGEKGINLPDSHLVMRALTDQARAAAMPADRLRALHAAVRRRRLWRRTRVICARR